MAKYRIRAVESRRGLTRVCKTTLQVNLQKTIKNENIPTIKKIIYVILFLHLFSCKDLHLGMRYQKSIVQGTLNDSLYCYHFAWGRDTESFISSITSDVCQGFDSSRDICFGRGRAEIYYKITADTLQIFSNINPVYPKEFKYHVLVQKVGHDDFPRLEQEVKDGKIDEISFDRNVSEVPCKVSHFNSPYLLKFR
jgi:hypothetical protein